MYNSIPEAEMGSARSELARGFRLLGGEANQKGDVTVAISKSSLADLSQDLISSALTEAGLLHKASDTTVCSPTKWGKEGEPKQSPLLSQSRGRLGAHCSQCIYTQARQ